MHDYSHQIIAFLDSDVCLSAHLEEILLSHREANRKRLINRLPDHIAGVHIDETCFKPQGSVAMQTVIQTKFDEEEYDIDDGVVLERSKLKDEEKNALGAKATKERVREALKDGRFNRQPSLRMNCVRVFYANEDKEKHHVDFPIYRTWKDSSGNQQQELASEDEWVDSNPTQINGFLGRIRGPREETGLHARAEQHAALR